MNVKAILQRYGGRAGGLMIYNAAKAAARTGNFRKHHLPLYPDTIPRVQWFFPMVDMGRVEIIKSANLPGNWFQSPDNTLGMTFGWQIYGKMGDMQYTYEGLRVLIHELVHVKQIRDLGEAEFARRYGEQFLEYGYDRMPLEEEANSYLTNLPFELYYYLGQNPDVKDATQGEDVGTFAHWLDAGIAEGRKSHPSFHVTTYLAKNQDLVDAGFDNYAAVRHWIEYGHAEGRVAI